MNNLVESEEGLNEDEDVTEKDVVSDSEEPSSTTKVVKADLEVETVEKYLETVQSNTEDGDEESETENVFKEDGIVMVMRKPLKWPAMVVETKRDEGVVKVLNKTRTQDVVKIKKIEKFIMDNRQMLGQWADWPTGLSFLCLVSIKLRKTGIYIVYFLSSDLKDLHDIYHVSSNPRL